MFGLFAQISIGGVIAILISRHLGPEAKGYSTLLTIGPSIIAWVVAMGLNPATMYFTSRSLDASRLLTGSFVLAFVFGAVGTLLGWLALAPGLGTVPAVRVALVVALALIFLQLLREFHGAALLGLHRVAQYAQLALAARVAGSALLVAAIYLAPTDVFYVAIPVSFAISNVFIVLAVRRLVRWRWAWSWPVLVEQLRYGLRSHLGDAVLVLLIRLDQFVVYALFGATALGFYSVAALCADFLTQAGQAAGNLFFARVSRAGARGPYLARLAVGTAALGLLALAIPLVLFAHQLVTLLFGQGFDVAVGPWRLLALAGAAEGTSRVAGLALRALGAPLLASLMNVAGLVLNLPLVIVLGQLHGLEGVALAMLLGDVVVLVIAYAALRSSRYRSLAVMA